MFFQASRQVRHFVGRLVRGENVHDAFLAFAQGQNVTAATLTAVGSLESVTLGAYDQSHRRDRPPRRFATAVELLSLTGNLTLQDGEPVLHLYATVSRETDNGIDVLGGRLFAAQAFSVEFSLTAYDDATLERSPDPGTGMPLWAMTPDDSAVRAPPAAPEVIHRSPLRGTPVEAPVPSVPLGPLPARALDASPQPTITLPPRFARPEEPEFTEEISAGDHLVHPRFGDVEVARVTDSGRLEIRLPTGSLREISVEIFAISARPEESGHKVWLLTNKVTR